MVYKNSIFYIFINILFFNCTQSETHKLQEVSISLLSLPEITDFQSNQNQPTKDIVNIGPELFSILSNRKTPIDSIKIIAQTGDVLEGDRDVSHSILYKTDNSQLIIKLKYDQRINQFHIVGFSGFIE